MSPPTQTTRPTSDRARESIFNIINSLSNDILINAHVLDGFAGTGALGLEALSRGAESVTFIEQDRRTAHVLKANIEQLQANTQCTVIEGSVLNPPKSSHPMNVIFLDPPYDQLIEDECLKILHAQGWVNAETLIVLEISSKRDLQLSSKANLITQRRYGAALISVLTYSS